MGIRREKAIEETLKYLPFKGNHIQFYKSYSDYYKLLGCKLSNVSPNKIISIFSLRNIKESSKTRFRETTKINFGYKSLKKSLKKFVEKFNSFNGTNKKNLEEPYISKIKGERGLIASFPIINPSFTHQKRKNKLNKKNTNIGSYFSVYLSKDENKILYFRGNDNLISWMEWWFSAKMNVIFKGIETKKFDSNKILQLLNNSDIGVFEMGLRYTEIGDSEKIILKSKMGNCYFYQKKISTAFEKSNLNLYDIDYIDLSYKKNQRIRIDFNRKKGFFIKLKVRFNNEKQIPKEIKEYMGDNIIIFDKVDEESLIRKVIQKEYLDLYEYDNIIIKPLLEDLKKIKAINISPHIKYLCKNPSCDFGNNRRSLMDKNICLCGQISNKKVITHYDVFADCERIFKLLSRGFRSLHIFSYKTMPDNYMNFKNLKTIRVKDGGGYIYFMINKKGLNKEDIENLEFQGLPFIIINLKGEIESTIKDFGSYNSGKLMFMLLKKDYSSLKEVIKKVREKYLSLKINSFNRALINLKKTRISANDFETAVFSIFNFTFKEAQKWGGKRLPDGSFPVIKSQIKYLLWDAKRYDSSSLLDYVNSNALKKDLPYMELVNENSIIKNFGKVKYYLFATSKTTKSEFLSIKDSIKKQIKKAKTKKTLKNVKILCIDKQNLIDFAEFTEQNFIALNSDYKIFQNQFINAFESNEGYFDFNLFKDSLKELIKKPKIYPSPEDLRKDSKSKSIKD